MKDELPYAQEHQRRVASSLKRTAAFRKATPKDKRKLLSEGKLGRNFLFASPTSTQGLAFVKTYFSKAIEKPHVELNAVTQAWMTCAPDYAKDKAQITAFKRGTLDITVPSSALKYTLDLELRTGLEQRLRNALQGLSLKKVKVSVGTSSTKSESDADREETEVLRRVQLSRVLASAEKGEL